MFALMATQQLSAQCPATTYSVGSGVGVANLSGAPAGVATLTAGQSVKITGTFTVDAGTWSMTGADVYFATTASEIIVNAGRTLHASTSIFQPCPGTAGWSAVRVLSGGTITAGTCTFTGDDEEGLRGNDYWALAPQEDETYAALHWEAQRYLYEKLTDHPALRQDAQAAAFYAASQEGNLGKFYAVETGLANLYDPTLTPDPVQTLTDLQDLNAGIVPEAGYQLNLRSINALRLSALIQNDWDFSAAQQATIDQIAALCPQAGGNAVYDARLLQGNYRVPDWNMDCAFVGDRSGAAAARPAGLTLAPNPAADQINVTLPLPAPGQRCWR